jgi:hypothetical protein
MESKLTQKSKGFFTALSALGMILIFAGEAWGQFASCNSDAPPGTNPPGEIQNISGIPCFNVDKNGFKYGDTRNPVSLRNLIPDPSKPSKDGDLKSIPQDLTTFAKQLPAVQSPQVLYSVNSRKSENSYYQFIREPTPRVMTIHRIPQKWDLLTYLDKKATGLEIQLARMTENGALSLTHCLAPNDVTLSQMLDPARPYCVTADANKCSHTIPFASVMREPQRKNIAKFLTDTVSRAAKVVGTRQPDQKTQRTDNDIQLYDDNIRIACQIYQTLNPLKSDKRGSHSEEDSHGDDGSGSDLDYN